MVENINNESFHSKYGYKQARRSGKNILYEGLLVDCPKDILDKLGSSFERRKFIIIYEL